MLNGKLIPKAEEETTKSMSYMSLDKQPTSKVIETKEDNKIPAIKITKKSKTVKKRKTSKSKTKKEKS
jgi:hypothetical protein